MSSVFPTTGIAQKHGVTLSSVNTALAKTITVPATHYGVLYKLWLDLTVVSEATLEALPDILTWTVTIGSFVFSQAVHPYIARSAAELAKIEWIDLGPWAYDFGRDGLYSGVRGEDIVFAVPAAGVNVAARLNYMYSD